MKYLIPVLCPRPRHAAALCAALALSFVAGSSARALEPAAAGDVSPADDAASQAQAQAAKAQRDASQQVEQAQQQVQKLQQDLKQSGSGGGGFGGGFGGSGTGNSFQTRLARLSGGGPSKPWIIRSSQLDSQEKLEEDLTVMAHLLDKAVNEKTDSAPRAHSAMGVNLVFAHAASPLRSLYLEGYGALFVLHVNFPLLAPPKSEAETPAGGDSAWEEARRELYGHPAPAGSAEPYSEEKVSQLKDSLLEALKNAANIRALKPDEWVTVCVGGGTGPTHANRTLRGHSSSAKAPAASPKPKRASEAEDATEQPEVRLVEPGSASGQQSVLTLRVRKSDAEAFAQGKLTLEKFRKQAHILVYPGTLDGAAGGTVFSWGGIGGGGGFGGGGF